MNLGRFHAPDQSDHMIHMWPITTYTQIAINQSKLEAKTCNWCQKRENTCAKSWLGFILPLIGWENSMFSLLGKSMLHNLIGLRSELSHWLRNIAREFTVKKLSLHQIHLSHFLLALFLFPYTQVLFLSFDALRSDCYACLAREIDSPWFN